MPEASSASGDNSAAHSHPLNLMQELLDLLTNDDEGEAADVEALLACLSEVLHFFLGSVVQLECKQFMFSQLAFQWWLCPCLPRK